MKKTLTSLVLGLVLTAGVSTSKADGLINFFTFNGNSAFGKVFSSPGVAAAGPTWMGQLLGGLSSGSLAPIGSPVAFLTGAGAGVINFGNVTVTGVEAGTPYFYALEAWSGASRPASDASNTSNTIQVTLGGTTSSGGFFATPQANGFNSFTVPEPTTFALAGLGIAALLVARRRK